MVGHFLTNLRKYGITVTTTVCCNMISDNKTKYGFDISPGAALQGKVLLLISYQSNNLLENCLCLSSFFSAINVCIYDINY